MSIVLRSEGIFEKPLYYYMKGHVFYYSYDIRDICRKPDVDLSINEKHFYLHNSGHNSLTLTETDFKYIKVIKPGTECTFDETPSGWSMNEKVFWEPRHSKYDYKTDEEYIHKLRELIENSVRKLAEKTKGKTIGCELSGGLDSSVIAILLNRMGYDVRYISWSLPPEKREIQPVDERSVIDDICKQEGITCEYLDPEDGDECDIIARNFPPFVNTLQISKTAKRFAEMGISYVFTGHGGDEGVSHRTNISEIYHNKEYGAYINRLWESTNGQSLRVLRVIKRFIRNIKRFNAYFKEPFYNDLSDNSSLFNNTFKTRMNTIDFPPLYFAFNPTKYVLSGGSRPRVENCAVQASDFGIEYLFPYLDNEVLDFALSIPRRLYYKNGTDRWIFREAFKDIMPRSLYEVDYKDFPSLRDNGENQEKAENNNSNSKEEKPDEKKRLEAIDSYLSDVDWDFWKDYLDYNKCHEYLVNLQYNLSEESYAKYLRFNAMILKCRLTDNMRRL